MDIGQYIYYDPGSEVIEGIYIGSLSTATNNQWLRENNIGAIVNLSGTEYPSEIPVYNILMDDVNVEPDKMGETLAKFDSGVEAITNARRQGLRVLIHCAAGINRSATLIGFYLIENGCPYEKVVEILTFANNRRSTVVLTNLSFRYLLCARDNFRRTFDNKGATLPFRSS
jgi:protein-tyrosine phosphatase